tara:strand:+ start:43139 stop:46447 length:3309 start_codon:yes stop_codon:yes gene_type:complete
MAKNIRIRTNPNGGDSHVKIQLNQDFDFLEILSLKISQEDVYRSFYSDYGVVVGRVIMNSGVGVPNARISVFIPLTDDDAANEQITQLYPYKDLQDVNSDGVRYNTLPKDAQGECHVPIGTFPTKRELVDNEDLMAVYQKYYKYTTTTNDAGDFMLFGVPVGNHTVNVDVDLSDIGIFSQRPYDFIEQGNPERLFDSPTKFRTNTNLNNLTQVKNSQVGVNVIPFWGEKESNEVGISRIDVDLNYNVKPKAIFMGSIFGDNEKNSVNKTCTPRKKLGRICEINEGEGTIQMLRKDLFGLNERFDVDGGRVINENGSWAYQIPMNLDYVITDEFGELIPTEDTSRGIPTRANVRFKINMDETGDEGRLRSRAKFLVPHNPSTTNEIDYSFDESTPDSQFTNIYWNKIYTVKNFISRFQRNGNKQNRNFVGFKDVDDCVGTKTPIPFNTIDGDWNPLFVILCIIIEIIVTLARIIAIFKKVRLPCNGSLIRIRATNPKGARQWTKCTKLNLAESLNVYEMDFYNDWLNGSLYAYLFKYKRKKSDEKFCGDGDGDGNNKVINSNSFTRYASQGVQSADVKNGLIASYEDELFYKPMSPEGWKLYPTDLHSLGSVFNCDWQAKSKINQKLTPTTYQFPSWEDVSILFDLTCIGGVKINQANSINIRQMCEIGVDIEDDTDNIINEEDLEDALVRNQLMILNDDNFTNLDVSQVDSSFTSNDYTDYRLYDASKGFYQSNGNSFYYYFGSKPNNTALDLMNSRYFTDCTRIIKSDITILGVVTNVSIVNGGNGAIDITVNGGILPYTYEWYKLGGEEDGSDQLLSRGEEDISNLSGGTYYVKVRDDNGEGALVKKTFIVENLRALSAKITTINTNQISASNGKIKIESITGGIKPYNVEISGSLSTPLNFNDISYSLFVSDLGYGSYTVKITDTAGTVKEYDVFINIPDAINVFEISKSDPSCIGFGDGRLVIEIDGGTPDFSVQLTDGISTYQPSNTGDTRYTFSDLASNNYTLTVVDLFDQTVIEGYTINEPLELLLSYSIVAPTTGVYLLSNTIAGVSYNLEKEDGTVLGTEIATGSSITWFIFPFTDTPGSQAISQFGCTSNLL